MYNVLNINALTLFLSRTPRRLKTSCESTSEEAGLARRRTKFKIPFQFPDLSKTACIDISLCCHFLTNLRGNMLPENISVNSLISLL